MKKIWTTNLLERAECFATNNAIRASEILQIMLELSGLRAIAVEHCRVCPNLTPELVAWFEKEVVPL
jgi:hypothetical protein